MLQRLFEYQGTQLRTIMADGEPWFVLPDVCKLLDIKNPSDVPKRLEEDDLDTVEVTDSLGRKQLAHAVNEYGLYDVVLISRKPEAKSFKRWITHEVIPSIRKTGQYSLEENKVVPLSKDQALVTVLRTTADLVEGQEEIKKEQVEIKRLIQEVDQKVEEQITLTSGEQRKLQKEIARRVYDLAERTEFQQLGFEDGMISPDLSKVKDKLFRQLHRAVKDCFAVPSYKDIRRSDFRDVLSFVSAWRPRLVA